MSLSTRRVGDLGSDRLEELPDRCRRCLFWELGAPRPLEPVDDEMAGDPLVQKAAWWRSVELDTGVPGRAVRADGTTAAYAVMAPGAAFAPRRPPVPPVSDDALLLATVWVEPAHRGGGAGRLLVQTAVKEALRLDLRAVEAYGDRRHRDSNCILPSFWLLHEGFTVHREHPRYPLLRLDVRTTARWTEPLEHAVGSAIAKLSRRPSPAPVQHSE